MTVRQSLGWGDRPVTWSSGLLLVGCAVGLGYILALLTGVLEPLTIGVAITWIGKQSVLWLLIPLFAWAGARFRDREQWNEVRHLLAAMLDELENHGATSADDDIDPTVDYDDGMDDLVKMPPPRSGRPNA